MKKVEPKMLSLLRTGHPKSNTGKSFLLLLLRVVAAYFQINSLSRPACVLNFDFLMGKSAAPAWHHHPKQ
jgi:phosphoglycerol transferase MdoB-like AlkP superfamily enzyme